MVGNPVSNINITFITCGPLGPQLFVFIVQSHNRISQRITGRFDHFPSVSKSGYAHLWYTLIGGLHLSKGGDF